MRHSCSLVLVVMAILATVPARAADVKPRNSNEAAVIGLLDMAFNQKRYQEAFARYVGPYYRQHNPTVADGKEALLASMAEFMPKVPGLRYHFKHLYSDGDRVIVHSHVQMSPEDRGIAVVDIFRLEKGLIVEHWDVVQPMPEKPLNDNGMF
jgi:predicted SnoaL-like aldol condensation-catalyzing enzyme